MKLTGHYVGEVFLQVSVGNYRFGEESRVIFYK